jgi:hypothetical protein
VSRLSRRAADAEMARLESRCITSEMLRPMDATRVLCKDLAAMATLPDGSYDVIVVDAETTEEGDVRLELTITLGPHVGRVVALRSRHVEGAAASVVDPLTLLGTPGTLRVQRGEPKFRPETV